MRFLVRLVHTSSIFVPTTERQFHPTATPCGHVQMSHCTLRFHIRYLSHEGQMTSAGSFVHGTDGKRRSKDEQDIAEFLSSIDEITSHAAAGRNSDRDGTGVSLRGAGSPGGIDLFFGPGSSTQADGGPDRSLLLEPEEGVAEAMPDDWLKDLETLQMDRDKYDSSAKVRTSSGPDKHDDHPRHEFQQQQQQQEEEQQQEHSHVTSGGTEILGMEPEILDGEYEDSYGDSDMIGSLQHNRPTDKKSASSGTKGVAGRSSGIQRGLGSKVGSTSAAMDKSSTENMEEQLDWPGTLDMLGMADPRDERPTEGSLVTAGMPTSELPSMPPPNTREENSYPDFVEVRDPRLVSQFPKPNNTLAAKVASARSADDSETSTGIGEDGKVTASQQQGHQVVLPAPLRTVEVYLRPDVTWESVSGAYMAVMLSRGLLVRHETEKSVTAEKVSEGSSDWTTVKLTVGVTRDKLRTLVIQFYSDTKPPILNLAGAVTRFLGRAGDDLYTAIRDALVEGRMPLSFLSTDASEVSLDPHYVRDLVAMYAHENMVNLTRYALPLEAYVQGEEERAAGLQASLSPQYRAYGLVPPRPTRSKPLSAYPLTTRRPPVSSCGVEEALEVLERARDLVGDISGDRDANGRDEVDGSAAGEGVDGKGSEKSAVAEGIRSLIRATWEDVKEWCDEEAEARVRRKDSQVRDRLVAVERHREALVAVLRDGAGGAKAASTPIGREFAARFRPMAQEAVLCHCSAVHSKRVGQLYLTCNHLCYHSSVLGFTSQRVLPLLTVASVSHASAALGMDVITLKDRGGEAHAFGITSVEAGFAKRFHDLLQQCLVLCKADASRRAAKQDASEPKEPDEEQILARVQRLAKAKQLRLAREAAAAAAEGRGGASAQSASSSPLVPRNPPSPESAASMSSNLASPSPLTETDKDPGLEGTAVEKVATVAPASATKGGGTEEAGVTPKGGSVGGRFKGGSMMAMGIQAFLEESQKRS